MYNGEFAVNSMQSHFLGDGITQVVHVKNIINILLGKGDVNQRIEAVKQIKFTSNNQKQRKAQEESHKEFIDTICKILNDENFDYHSFRFLGNTNKEVVIKILLCYVWVKSGNFKEAKEDLDIYNKEHNFKEHNFREEELETKTLTELINTDPARIFPPIVEQVIIEKHKDCAENVVRNFLNFIILDKNGKVKECCKELIYGTALNEWYSKNFKISPADEIAKNWRDLLIDMKVDRVHNGG